MLIVAPSSSSRFSPLFNARSTAFSSTASEFHEARLFDPMKYRHQQAVFHSDHEADMRASRLDYARFGQVWIARESCVHCQETLSSASATACRRKSFTESLCHAPGSLAPSSARAACTAVQSTALVSVNWGIVALLNVMARAMARRMLESFCSPEAGGISARGVRLRADCAPHVLELHAPARPRACDASRSSPCSADSMRAMGELLTRAG